MDRLQLVEYPTEEYGTTLLYILIFDVVGSFVWDRLMLLLFAPHIFKASMQAITLGVGSLVDCFIIDIIFL